MITFVVWVREDPAREGLLYLGTEFGLYISFDAGEAWQRFQLNLPISPIYDLKLKDTDLIVATHGRSFWILDDVTVLHQIDPHPKSLPDGSVSTRPHKEGGTFFSPSLHVGRPPPNGGIYGGNQGPGDGGTRFACSNPGRSSAICPKSSRACSTAATASNI